MILTVVNMQRVGGIDEALLLCGFCFSSQLFCPAVLAAAAEAVPREGVGQKDLSVSSYLVLSFQIDFPYEETEPNQEPCKNCAGGLGQPTAAAELQAALPWEH